ncbi:MAG: flagellar biosynthesis anti-sigma factor FlgM [Sphingomonas sp.]
MVDPVGTKPGTIADRRVAVAAADPVAAPQPVKPGDPQTQAAAPLLSRALAAQPPVDADRVTRIRKAIQDGRFPIFPATVADRLLALKLEWNPNE